MKLRLTLTLSLAAGLISTACGGTAANGVNVILISLDTTRADHLSLYGYERDTTPNINRFAARGTVFERNYAQAPNTAPSHTTMLTGLYPSVHGVWSHGMTPDPRIPVLPQVFQQHGYRTVAWVQLQGGTYNRGFDEYHDMQRRWAYVPERPKEIVDWLRDNGDRPFFMMVHTYEPHAPYHPPEAFRLRYDEPYEGPLRQEIVEVDDLRKFNEGEWPLREQDLRHIIALYDAEIAYIDDRLGVLFDALDELGLADRTVVALVADHGEEFNDHGQVGRHSYTIYNELMHVPMLIVGPGVEAGVRVDTPVGNVDLAPTLLSLAGIAVPRIYQGVDLAPLWRGEEFPVRPVVVERPGQRAIISGRFKYHDDGRLFDLEADPYEQVDVAAEHATEVAFLRDRLDRWLASVAKLQERVAPAGDVRLTQEERERLKALGYLQ